MDSQNVKDLTEIKQAAHSTFVRQMVKTWASSRLLNMIGFS